MTKHTNVARNLSKVKEEWKTIVSLIGIAPEMLEMLLKVAYAPNGEDDYLSLVKQDIRELLKKVEK